MTEQVESDEAKAQINKVSIKPSPFWKNDPVIWFAQLEAQFKLSGITVDDTKYNTVLTAVDSEILQSVRDIILQPPDNKKYETIKCKLIDVFTASENAKLRQLLQEVKLGDNKPSQLLLTMKNLAADNFSDEALKSLWISRLPQNIQAILAVSQEKLAQLSVMADKIYELTSFEAIASISQTSSSSFSNLEQQVQELTRQVNRLVARDVIRKPYRIRPRSSSRRRFKPRTNTMCFYHVNFADKARKCSKPCNFNEGNATGGQ